jgi:tRNA-dihydrouridine synthase B
MELHLASMENVTCWAFRKLMQGATDAYTGILSMNYLVTRTKAWKEIDTFKIDGQRQWIQLSTSKEKECADFLNRIDRELKLAPEKDNIYGLQLNLSCPSPKIINIGQGPALIKRTQKVASLVKELLKQDKFKVSVKTRLGLNEKEVAEKRIIRLFEELKKIDNKNFTEIAVHFKHAKQPSFDRPDYSMLKELCGFDIPIVINGGIRNYSDFSDIIKNLSNSERKNLKGLMIGRTALGNPDCFVEISNLINGTNLKKRSPEQISLEFKRLCEEHNPRPIYQDKIKELCKWNR